MSSAVATQNGNLAVDIAVVEKVITGGDLGQLTPEQRVRYYIETCDSLRLNWKTKPFDVVALRGSGAKTLYPNKGCAEQLAGIHNISVDLLEATVEEGVRIQKAKACLPNGRCVTKTGAVTVAGKRGDDYANAVMKCETKAHRRAVLALVGLNMPDESELETIHGSQRYTMDVESGEFDTAPQSNITPPTSASVVAEVVDASTGEIQPTKETADQKKLALGNAIKELRESLGWDAERVRQEAATRSLSLNSVAGLMAMVTVLQEYVAIAKEQARNGDEEDYEAYEASAAQPTLLDADVRPVDRWGD